MTEETLEQKWVWRVLERPNLYRLSQWILAPGSKDSILREIKKWLNRSPACQRELDIGCGPASLLWRVELCPIGLDPIHAYNVRFKSKGRFAITGSAMKLPFRDGSFSRVWNFGLLHHLSDEKVDQALGEMLRITHPGGWIVVFDGVMPSSLWPNPLIWVLRKLDRGRHMRKQQALESLLFNRQSWSIKRFRYSLLGHEGALCVYQKQ